MIYYPTEATIESLEFVILLGILFSDSAVIRIKNACDSSWMK